MFSMKTNMTEEILQVARGAAVEAGDLLAREQQTDFEISKKGPVNLVTEMDLKAEQMIVDRILKSFPDHRILAEERGSEAGKAPITWVIDPLDGTTNYAHGYRFFCVSIGVEVEGEMLVGAVYDPVCRELFAAIRGGGATLNGEVIQVSKEKSLQDSLLCTGFSYGADEIEANLKHFNRVMKASRSVRRDGSAALDLCYVACGRFDGFWELSLHPWDVAAGSLIVQEAGGQVTLFDGSPCTIYDRECLATNGLIHSLVGEELRRAGGR
jgi:myo-inositol-1(or 4)-monophosphatase